MREKWIDNAKGFAILLVILGHAGGDYAVFRWVFGVHLVMFFLLSGYTFRRKPLTKDFLNRKFSRLMTPYFMTCAMTLLTDMVLFLGQSTEVVSFIIIRDLVRSFFASGAITNFGALELNTIIGAIWFLPALFFATMFFQIILNLWEGTDTAGGIAAAVLAGGGYLSARFIWFPFSIQAGMLGTFFLWLGYEIRKSGILTRLRPRHYAVALLILLAGIYFGYCNLSFVTADMVDVVLSPVVGLAGCLLIYGVSILDRGVVLSYLGKLSLTLMCTHLYIMSCIAPYLYALSRQPGLSTLQADMFYILLHLLFAVAVAVGIDRIRPHLRRAREALAARIKHNARRSRDGRDASVDAARGMFLSAMILAGFPTDGRLRMFLSSCYAVAFVFLSGTFYCGERSTGHSIRHAAKTLLLPYGIYAVCALLLNIRQWHTPQGDWELLKNWLASYAAGFSATPKLFPGVQGIGPVSFLPMLFLVRALYRVLDRLIQHDAAKWAAVAGISLFGFWLGKQGFWLPWNLDAACYCLVFYRLGLFFPQKGWLRQIMDNHFWYFILSPIWAYMIYMGSMDPNLREYGPYGLGIAGAVAGILLVLKLTNYMTERLPLSSTFLRSAGEAGLAILGVHSLLGQQLSELLASRFDTDYVPFLALSLLLQFLLGILIHRLLHAGWFHRESAAGDSAV